MSHYCQAYCLFKPAPDQPWASVKDSDDVAAVFFDATGNGHPDLLITGGGVKA